MDFKIGDVVALKSGVPNMTVMGFDKDSTEEHPLVKCCWRDNNDTKNGSFPSEILEKVPYEAQTTADKAFAKLYEKK